eukprot:Nitzschia sp. Nitz4//scaffold21_size171442//127911//130441//NITZ4_002182-RA/size171442-augustus-gene-0.207-mRNA-1//-1//CDS//3329542474//700//frame0
MKLSAALLAVLAVANAECSGSTEYSIGENTKLSFSGYLPSVTRTLNTGVGNKIILKNYEYEPVIQEGLDGSLQISLGEPCDTDSETGSPTGSPTEGDNSSAASYLGWGLASMFMGQKSAIAGSTLALAMAVGFMSSAPVAMADDVISSCELAPIEVEIYIDASSEEIVSIDQKAGQYMECPPETQWWSHHEDAFGGYEGCVAEKGLYPCAHDALGTGLADEIYQQSPVYWDGVQCVETDYTMANKSLWVMWGSPMDKYEIITRTGLNPVISFPFTRMPYPQYAIGGDPTSTQDESNDAKLKAKEMLEYIGAWTVDELESWSVTLTEGAEQGMVYLFAAKALEIAMTTCNRNIRVLNEVPSYGYSTGDAARIANMYSSQFYNSSECECFADDSCKDATVSVSYVGWLPNTPLPTAVGGDGLTYSADSASSTSPWIESMVFPENPSGVFKTPQIPDPNRRVCDGVYIWPQYMGGNEFVVPKDDLPECASWSFSVSKIYSAGVRAGWVMYNQEYELSHSNVVRVMGQAQSMTQGLYSEWSWYGQQQLFDIFMSKPLDDPTSWISAYASLIKEKWDFIIDGFEGCPVTSVSNPYSGAYVWFVFLDPYVGVQDGSTPSFFSDVLGVYATTYSWGFRGADPADYYGPGYSGNDFTRLQLYRDLHVYEEIGRRAKIACQDLDAAVSDDLVSVNQWVAANTRTRDRRLNEGYESIEDRKRHLKEVVPELTDIQVNRMAKTHHENERQNAAVEACAPEYSTSCLFKGVGIDKPDELF